MTQTKQVLVVINGAPGVGKTTLLRRLGKDLQLPAVGKDDIKELLFDRMGVGDRQWSRDVGAAVANMVFVLISTWVGKGRSLIIESAFYRDFASPEIAKVLQAHPLTFVEVYCTADPDVRRQRFSQRIIDGSRHPGHADPVEHDGTPEEVVLERYGPLDVGPKILVDTTKFGDEEYRALLERIQQLIK